MYILNHLIDFYNASWYNWSVMLLATWLIFPGSVFIVGVIFESRLVPIWRHQSRAFIPGDLAFGVIFVRLIRIYATYELESPPNSWYAWVIVTVFIGGIAMVLSMADGTHYPPESRRSPTKLTHDVMGYFIAPTVLVSLAMDILGLMIMGAYEWRYQDWTLIVLNLMFYIVCVLIDISGGYTQEDILARHPNDWVPIWHEK